MQAIIMAGGFGTRLRPLTCNIPKPMVPIMNTPMIGHIVQLLKQHGFDDIIVMLFFQPESIIDYLGDGSVFGVKIQYLQPEVDLGTAGSVKFAEKYLHDTFLVISGDLLTDAELTDFLTFHRSNNGDASILLTKVANPLPFGVVITDKNHRITQFLEKPSWGEVFSDRINSGIYIFEPKILDKMKPNTEYDFGKDVFPRLLEDDTRLLGYPAEGYWKDIGNLDEYLFVHQDFLAGKVKVTKKGKRKNGLYIGENTSIGKNVQFMDSVVLDNNVRIEDGAFLQSSVIGNDTVIRENARIINSIVWDNVSVGDNSQIKNSVISSYTQIGSGAVVSDKAFIGEDVIIGERCLIKPQVKIWPKKTIANDTILSTSIVWGDRWLRELFTDARVSGIANIEITPEFAAKFGTALGAFWGKGKSIYSSRDSDNASHMISNALQAGLNSMGVNVEDLEHTPIPVVRQVLSGSNLQGGMHIRRSPYTDKNIDIILFDSNGLDLHTNTCKKIERLFFGEDYVRIDISQVGTKKYYVSPLEIYRHKFFAAVDKDVFKERPMKVVIDFSYGPASTIFPAIMNELDVNFITINGYLSPTQSYYTGKKRIAQAKQLAGIVTSLNADIGFIIDKTCERLFLVDNSGRFYKTTDLLAIVAKLYFQHYKPECIAAPLNAPSMIRRLAEENGVGYYSCKCRHRSMIETAMKDGISFVGGTLGGYIFTDFGYASDAMFASIRILEMIAKLKSPISELIDTIQFPNIVKNEVACSWEEKGKVMGALMNATANMKRELIQGVKVYVDDSWIVFMPAVEEPLFSVIAESPTKEKAEKLVNEWTDKINAWRDQ